MAEETLNTRDRVLETCLRLFNEAGPDAVTTAEIAGAVGINEGNLYYYFKRKQDILLALFEQFEAAMNQVASVPQSSSANPDAALEYLKRWFNLMWEWRFFYRDGASVMRVAPKLRGKNMKLADRGQAEIRLVLQGMVENGLLRMAPAEIDRLVVNAWIVSSYWLDYLHCRHNVTRVTRDHLDWGFSQVLSLFLPYIMDESLAKSLKFD
ncbi:TetR/AcrR family transcriptional regulator [Noviherbaspirillum massiliense]|uniref:TetR/AcrR family transcriptional regulator n=1 Tax=Noviherbaspirillum massiliense TaxID=1465823 RepID=UPI0003035AF2|nr:TetR/AcrR family transcriptional regulator [Noviherbaspirillum massiliense]